MSSTLSILVTNLTAEYLKLSAEFAIATNDYKDITEESTKIVMQMAHLEKEIVELLPTAFRPVMVSGMGWVLKQYGEKDFYACLQPIRNPKTVAMFKLLPVTTFAFATFFDTEERAKTEARSVNYAMFRSHVDNSKKAA